MRFDFDLTSHETVRVAAVLAGSPDFDPAAALADEQAATALLHSNLDAAQTATLAMLRSVGLG